MLSLGPSRMYRSCPVARRARFKSALIDGMDHNSAATLWDSLLHHVGGGVKCIGDGEGKELTARCCSALSDVLDWNSEQGSGQL